MAAGLYPPNRNPHIYAILSEEVLKIVGKRCVLSLLGKDVFVL